jgi:two-component system cell cycle sensor histidine kinase/response regulator CckA
LRAVGALLAVVLGTTAVTSLLGALVLMAYGVGSFWQGWFNWWAGDGMAVLILTPVILAWGNVRVLGWPLSRRQNIETIGVMAVVAVLAFFLLSPTSGAGPIGNRGYLVFPLLIWAAIRSGPWGSAHAMLVLAIVAGWFSGTHSPTVSTEGAAQAVPMLDLYSFLALATISSIIPAAMFEERTSAAADLRASEHRFREIAAYVTEAFFVVDIVQQKTLYVSPSWATIWQRPLAEGYHPHLWFEAIHLDDRQAMVDAQQRTARGEVTEQTFRIHRPDGTMRFLRGRTYPIRGPSGKVERFVGLTADITELQASEQRFHQAQKLEAVGRLAGGVAHDFNNLLTVMLVLTDELGVDKSLSPDARESIQHVRSAAESAAALTRQLLAFSRHQLIEPRAFDLNGAVTNTAKLLRRLIGEDIDLQVHLAPDALGVFADPGQIEQVLTNLAVNARDAMPRGGILSIETWASLVHPNEVTLSISDTGSGMTPQVLAQAFEPFFTTKPMGLGTGLGLATCHGIITQAGGRISIQSQPGQGTRVNVVLPLVPLPVGQSVAAAGTALPRGSERILLVEDETNVRVLTARILRAQGYAVVEARDADEALRHLEGSEPSPDMLMTDVVLPGMSGRELAEKLHESHPGIPALFATGYTDDAMLQNRDLSPDAVFLHKPFTRESLARRVRDVLDSRTKPDG